MDPTMVRSMTEVSNVADKEYTAVVKNTFISFDFKDADARSQSVPPSLRLCSQDACSSCCRKLSDLHANSESSTDACTDRSDGEDSDGSTPLFRGHSTDSFVGDLLPATTDSYSMSPPAELPFVWHSQFFQEEPQPIGPMFPLLVHMPSAPPPPHVHRVPARLNVKAAAFTPKAAVSEDLHCSGQCCLETLRQFAGSLQESDLVKNVEISNDFSDCSIVVQVHDGHDSVAARVLTLAQEMLLDAAGRSKSVYVLGYASAKAFRRGALGFECTLGSMENPVNACWHMFKKGFCGHEGACIKQHPSYTLPVRVLVETVDFEVHSDVATAFKMQVADLIITVISTLREDPQIGHVAAWKSKETKCWTIELSSQTGSELHKEYLPMIAKDAFHRATTSSQCLYMMGYQTKPFLVTSTGFVAVVGDMQAESRACWSFYTKGCCAKQGACRWEHPTCLMPIRVVIKAEN